MLVRAARDVGLGLVDRLPGLKRRLVSEAAGLTGDLPASSNPNGFRLGDLHLPPSKLDLFSFVLALFFSPHFPLQSFDSDAAIVPRLRFTAAPLLAAVALAILASTSWKQLEAYPVVSMSPIWRGSLALGFLRASSPASSSAAAQARWRRQPRPRGGADLIGHGIKHRLCLHLWARHSGECRRPRNSTRRSQFSGAPSSPRPSRGKPNDPSAW